MNMLQRECILLSIPKKVEGVKLVRYFTKQRLHLHNDCLSFAKLSRHAFYPLKLRICLKIRLAIISKRTVTFIKRNLGLNVNRNVLTLHAWHLALINHQPPTASRNSPNAKCDRKCQIRTGKRYSRQFFYEAYCTQCYSTGQKLLVLLCKILCSPLAR